MKQKNSARQILRLALTLFIITAVMAAVLAGVNAITKDKIAADKQARSRLAMEAVLPGGEDLTALEMPVPSDVVQAVYKAGENSPVQGYVVEVTPSGFGGEITMMVGIRDGAVSGVSIVSHSETPSLGAVIGESSSRGESFRNQFIGMSGVLAVAKDGGQVQAVTSATISSRAVTAGVNAALEYVDNLG